MTDRNTVAYGPAAHHVARIVIEGREARNAQDALFRGVKAKAD